MNAYATTLRLAVLGVIEPPSFGLWLSVYAQSDASQDELIRSTVRKIKDLAASDVSFSSPWVQPVQRELQDLCRGTWRRRLAAPFILKKVIADAIKKGDIAVKPGAPMRDGTWRYDLIVQVMVRRTSASD